MSWIHVTKLVKVVISKHSINNKYSSNSEPKHQIQMPKKENYSYSRDTKRKIHPKLQFSEISFNNKNENIYLQGSLKTLWRVVKEISYYFFQSVCSFSFTIAR